MFEITLADVFTKADTYDMVARAFGDGKGAFLVSEAQDMRLWRKGIGASVEARDLVKIFDNYDDARAWVGLPEDYPDPFEDEW